MSGRFLLGILALMVVVFSCPVKKVFAQSENIIGTTTSHKVKHEAYSLEIGSVISALGADCCLHKSDVKSIGSQQTFSVDQPSFDDVELMLSTIPIHVAARRPTRLCFPVLSNFRPLFLQHASLLI